MALYYVHAIELTSVAWNNYPDLKWFDIILEVDLTAYQVEQIASALFDVDSLILKSIKLIMLNVIFHIIFLKSLTIIGIIRH